MSWAALTKKMHESISSSLGPSREVTYTLRSGAAKVMRGVYESPYHRQAAGDMDMETYIVEREPRVGVDTDEFTEAMPRQIGATVRIEGESGIFRVTKFEPTNPGWVEMVLEKTG